MKRLILWTPLILLCSCAHVQTVSGVLLDKATGLPLEAVQVSLNAAENVSTHSDAAGHFSVSRTSRGFGKRPDLKLVWTKNGYQEQSRQYAQDTPNDTIWLEPLTTIKYN